MGLRWIIRTLLGKWYLAISGVMLSAIAAAGMFSSVPATYSSSGVLVLVQPKQPGTNSSNPLLNFDTSLSTTAALLVQQLDTTAVALAVRTDPASTYTVKNVGEVTTHDLSVQPFVYLTTQSPSREDAVAMVSRVTAMAQQALQDRQDDLKVRRSSRVMLESVVDPTTAKYVFGSQVAATGGALMSGIATTLVLILAWERFVSTRRRPSPTDGEGREPVVAWLPRPVDPRMTSMVVPSNGVKPAGGNSHQEAPVG